MRSPLPEVTTSELTPVAGIGDNHPPIDDPTLLDPESAIPVFDDPPVSITLPRSLALFIERNCDSNIAMALALLQDLNRPAAERVVPMLEDFKELRRLTREALSD